jgi:hypothetical protein
MHLQNTTDSDISLLEIGIDIPANGEVGLTPSDLSDLKRSETLLSKLLSGEVVFTPHSTPEAGDVAAMTIYGDTLPSLSPQFITKYAFRQRFTPSEKYQISNSSDSIAKMALLDFYSALYVNLASDVVDDYLNLLVSLSILSSARKAEILTY